MISVANVHHAPFAESRNVFVSGKKNIDMKHFPGEIAVAFPSK